MNGNSFILPVAQFILAGLVIGTSLSLKAAVQYFITAGLIGTIISMVVIKFFGRKTIMVSGNAIQMIALAIAGLTVLLGYNILCYICLLISTMTSFV